MALEGKGFYMWQIHRCQDGDPAVIAALAKQANLTHVLVKIADGSSAYNVDLAEPVVNALKAAGIQAWGWQYVYGDEPFGEADIAVHRIRTLNLDGFVINAEVEYKRKYAAASAYMESLRSRVSGIPIALSSFRYPRYHPELPWTEFLTGSDYNMPQVYWVQADNPGWQLEQSVQQFQSVYPNRPILATGAAYAEYGWRPTPTQVRTFMQKARDMGIPAVNFWSWDYASSPAGEDLWNVIANFSWPVSSPPTDITDRLMMAMNRQDLDAILALYHDNAVHVTPERTISGHTALRNYYTDLLTNLLPGASFIIETRVSAGTIRNIRWDATGATNGKSVNDGQDTIGLRGGLIQYHSSLYRIQ